VEGFSQLVVDPRRGDVVAPTGWRNSTSRWRPGSTRG